MEKHGKLTFRTLETYDLPKLEVFCKKCEQLGYENNKNFNTIKLDQMSSGNNKFFIGIDETQIFNLAGVHEMPEYKPNAYRCLFRGAVLPGYITGKGFLKNSWQFTVTLNQQINFILNINLDAEFYLTSNKVQDNGKSSVIDRIYNPRAERQGILKLIDENFYYNHTHQRLWKINVNRYKDWINCKG